MGQAYTWYSDASTIDSADTIHQILRYGTLKEINELMVKIGSQKLKDIFCKHPKKIYSPASYNFISKFVLAISQPLKSDDYLSSTPRNTG